MVLRPRLPLSTEQDLHLVVFFERDHSVMLAFVLNAARTVLEDFCVKEVGEEFINTALRKGIVAQVWRG